MPLPSPADPFGATTPQAAHAPVPQPTRDAPSQPIVVPQPVRDAPSQPNYMGQQPGGPVPGQPPAHQQVAGFAPTPSQQAATTQHTRSATDSALDRPPKNMLPIYAAIVLGVIAVVVVLIVVLT